MNNTSHLTCPDIYQHVDMCDWSFLLKATFLSMIALAIVAGNSLVIFAVARHPKLRRNVSNSLIASLAVADLLLGVAVLPLAMIYELLGYWAFSKLLCRLWLSVDVWICTASILHLCAISMDRFVAISYPLRYPNIMTHCRGRLICFLMWVVAFLIGLPSIVGWGKEVVEGNATVLPECSPVGGSSSGYIIYSAMGSFFIPSAIMVGFYVKIFLTARRYLHSHRNGQMRGENLRIHRGSTLPANRRAGPKQHRRTNSLLPFRPSLDKGPSLAESSFVEQKSSVAVSQSCESDNSTNEEIRDELLTRSVTNTSISRETRAAKTLAIIVGCFIACWTPFFVTYTIQGVSNVQVNPILFDFFIWVGYVNSLLNPCIYAYFSKDYRHAFRTVLRLKGVSRKKTWRVTAARHRRPTRNGSYQSANNS